MSKSLMELIESLSKSEKRYIHLNLKTYVNNKENNYFLEDFVTLEQFASKKPMNLICQSLKSNSTRLQHRILDILFQFHEADLPGSDESARKLRRAKVLIQKGFYRDAFKLMDKIIYEANDSDYLSKMEALEMKMETAIKFADIDFLKHDLKNHRELFVQLNKEYANLMEFQSLEALIKLESTTYYFYNDQNELAPSYKKLLEDEQNAFHPMAKIFFNKANAFLQFKSGKAQEAQTYARRAIELFENYPSVKKKNILTYLKSLRNLCIICIQQKKFNEAEKLLNEAEKGSEFLQKHITADVKTELFTLMVLLRMEIIISGGSVAQNLDKLENFSSAFESTKDLLRNDEKASSYMNLAVFNFEAGKYRVSLRYILNVLNYAKDVRKDLQHLAYMAEITLHYFLGNSDVLHSKINAYKRFLQKDGVIFSFELPAISHLQAVSDNPHVTGHYKMLQKIIITSLTEEGKLMYVPYIFFLKLKPLH